MCPLLARATGAERHARCSGYLHSQSQRVARRLGGALLVARGAKGFVVFWQGVRLQNVEASVHQYLTSSIEYLLQSRSGGRCCFTLKPWRVINLRLQVHLDLFLNELEGGDNIARQDVADILE